MAVTVRSHGQSPGSNTISVLIVKPVGLAEGDLMIAQVFGYDKNGTIGVFTSPGGWTDLRQDDAADADSGSSIHWKIADSGDVAAANFEFTAVGTQSSRGCITAIEVDTFDPAAPINQNNGAPAGAPTTAWISPGVTPSVGNCLIMLFAGIEDNAFMSTWGITTSDPGGWTEQYDLPSNLTDDLSLAMAYDIRLETTATGNGTGLIGGSDMFTGQMLAIAPPAAARRIFITHV